MISVWDNLKDKPEVLLLTSAEIRAMQETSHILDRHQKGRVQRLVSVTEIFAGGKRIKCKDNCIV